MATDKNGFTTVKLNNVQIDKATTTSGKSEFTLKLELETDDAMQLASYAHRKAHLKMTLTEFDPELPTGKS